MLVGIAVRVIMVIRVIIGFRVIRVAVRVIRVIKSHTRSRTSVCEIKWLRLQGYRASVRSISELLIHSSPKALTAALTLTQLTQSFTHSTYQSLTQLG